MKQQITTLQLSGAILLMAVAGCGADPEFYDSTRTATQAVKQTLSCTANNAETTSLLSFSASASYEILHDVCGLPSDAARQVARRDNFACIEDLASTAEVGNATLTQLVACGQRQGKVSSQLSSVHDGPGGKYDIAVAFTTTEAQETLAFANNASAAELQTVSGIGPVLSDLIIFGRPIRTVHNLRYVVGIGIERLTNIKAAAIGWEAPLPPDVTPPEPGSLPLSSADARLFLSVSVDAFMASMGEDLWYGDGYWAFGGDMYTNDFSKNFFLRHIEASLYDATWERLQGFIGQEFDSEQSALEFIDALVWTTFQDDYYWWLEAYPEYIGEATA